MSLYPSRKSLRLEGYDYSRAGGYFVTLCTEERRCLFGDVVNGEMKLNALGQMVHDVWGGLAEHYPYTVVDKYMVMPNHLHGIVFLTGDERGARPADAIDLQKLMRNVKQFTARQHGKGAAD